MSDPKKKATADLSKGVSAAGLDDGGTMLGHVGDQDVVLVRSGSDLFAVGQTARTTAGRSLKESSSATPSGVRCITRASACAPSPPARIPCGCRFQAPPAIR
jgi:hypothetical protein